jgi:hypothetical protein
MEFSAGHPQLPTAGSVPPAGPGGGLPRAPQAPPPASPDGGLPRAPR